MAELLFELFSEEIPARMQLKAAEDLGRLVKDKLYDAGFMFEEGCTFVTPRRLALVIEGLPEVQPDRREERKGPKVGAPEKAIEGFLGSVGMTIDQVEKREGPKGEFYVAVIEEKGRPTSEVLQEVLPDIIRNFPWPKSQRWGSGTMRWVRPLHSILCLFNEEIVNIEVDGIKSSNVTRGHRFLAPEAFEVTGFEDYADKLEKAFVVLNRDRRMETIAEEAKQLAFAQGFELIEDKGLLEEVAGLVEFPVVLMGTIDDEFMAVPPEVLITSMKEHQKYFSLRDPKTGHLAPRFIVVSNMKTADNGTQIVDGNERVLRARLSDAKFFWDQDLKSGLEGRVERLKDMVFHARLGTVHDKVARIRSLAGLIAGKLGADTELADRAALLAKADLNTDMVFEFTELQGLMGGYYAEAAGEAPEVAAAIRDHYAPQGPGDECPSEPIAIAVSMADKIDTLTGFWAIDEKPTGSKDPYALRRAALGVIRLVLENNLRLNLLELFKAGAETQSVDGAKGKRKVNYVEVGDLLSFFAQRLQVHLRGEGVRHDLIDAVFGLGGQDDLVLIIERVRALEAFLASDDGANLLVLFRRAANILAAEEKKDKAEYRGSADVTLFEQEEERVLAAQLESVIGLVGSSVEHENFADAMGHLARLRAPVDAFFDHVTVNDEDAAVRRNRLLLLSGIRSTMMSVADFSKIEG